MLVVGVGSLARLVMSATLHKAPGSARDCSFVLLDGVALGDGPVCKSRVDLVSFIAGVVCFRVEMSWNSTRLGFFGLVNASVDVWLWADVR